MLLQEVIDRETIRDTLYTFCRGVDRGDPELVQTVFWSDATYESPLFVGSVAAWIDQMRNSPDPIESAHHVLANVLIDLEGSIARVESYYHACFRMRGEDGRRVDLVNAGRFLDTFVRAGEEWRIRRRTVVRDWMHVIGEAPNPQSSLTPSIGIEAARSQDDPSYRFFSDR